MFKCVDEINQFSFDDCVVNEIEKAEDGLVMTVSSLIVKPGNSQNSNCTESYAGDTEIKFQNSELVKILKCGYRYYDADGKLIKSVPDEDIDSKEWNSLLKSLSGNYLPVIEKKDGNYEVEIECIDEDGSQGNSYLLILKSDSVIISWERYMNRVQR